MKKEYRLLQILIIIALLLTSQILSVISYGHDFTFPFYDYSEGDVAYIINDEYQGINNTQPSIDIKSLNNNITSSQIELNLYGIPILDPSHGYRILINWNGVLNLNYIYILEIQNWNLAVPSTANITLCFAGGLSGFGISNGSYTRLCNSSGTPILTESRNNTVSLVGNSLVFPFNQTLITTPSKPVDVLVVTTYNSTTSEISGTSTSVINKTWIDSTEDKYILDLYNMVTAQIKINLVIFIGIIGIIVTSQVIYLKRRK